MPRRKSEMCSECGAELRLGPTRCPLCGGEPPVVHRGEEPTDLDSYHSHMQELRDQLRKLREGGAEAV